MPQEAGQGQIKLPWFWQTSLLLAMPVGLSRNRTLRIHKRSREIGVRMALGAQGRDVLRLVVRHGMGLTLCGVIIGLVGPRWRV